MDITSFVNLGRNHPYTKTLNQSDPLLSYEHKAAPSAKVPNPPCQHLTSKKLPGPLRNQKAVTVGPLSKPYRPYASSHVAVTPGSLGRYRCQGVEPKAIYRSLWRTPKLILWSASESMRKRSCEAKTIAPGNWPRAPASASTASISRWLVGARPAAAG